MPAPLPRDDNSIAIPLTPAVAALGRLVSSSLSSSTTRNLTTGTTIIRCYATSQDVYLKWGSTAVDATNFDEILPAGQVVDLVVPRDSAGTLYTTIRLIERTPSASLVIIDK